MKTFLSIIFFFCINFGYAQKIKTILDPVTKVNWKITNFKVRSTGKINFQNQRYKANLEFLCSGEKDNFTIEMRLNLRTNIEDWPLKQNAYIILNDKQYEIELKDIHSDLYYIESATIKTLPNGTMTTEISTKDFQLFRKHIDLNNTISPKQSVSNFALIIYSGNKPIQFKLKNKELKLLENLMVEQ